MSTIISQKDILGLSKDTPFASKVISRKLLSKKGSTKATYHLTMDLSQFNSSFNEGDAFGIYPKNHKSEVSSILSLLQLDQDEEIQNPKSKKNEKLFHFLSFHTNLNKIHSKLLIAIKEFSSDNSRLLDDLLDPQNKDKKKLFIQDNDILTTLEVFKPKNMPSQVFCDALLPMLPRFYSCASSYHHSNSSVDFLISTFEYEKQSHLKVGVGSDYLCHQVELETEPVLMYLQKNEKFQLPDDLSIPIIMIGPGTGVAPFRAFIQKRAFQKASKNWLFFGERHQNFDFYYEDEWSSYQNQNLLTLDLAFSRDQGKKIYVQDKLYNHRKKLIEWLNSDAIIYVCGDARHMEKDVKNTLIRIFEEELSLSCEQAKEHFKALKKQKRYLCDVY